MVVPTFAEPIRDFFDFISIFLRFSLISFQFSRSWSTDRRKRPQYRSRSSLAHTAHFYHLVIAIHIDFSSPPAHTTQHLSCLPYHLSISAQFIATVLSLIAAAPIVADTRRHSQLSYQSSKARIGLGTVQISVRRR